MRKLALFCKEKDKRRGQSEEPLCVVANAAAAPAQAAAPIGRRPANKRARVAPSSGGSDGEEDA